MTWLYISRHQDTLAVARTINCWQQITVCLLLIQQDSWCHIVQLLLECLRNKMMRLAAVEALDGIGRAHRSTFTLCST